MRLNLMTRNTEQQSDYDEELLDNMDDLPEDGENSPDVSADGGRIFGNSEISMQTTELARQSCQSLKRSGGAKRQIKGSNRQRP